MIARTAPRHNERTDEQAALAAAQLRIDAEAGIALLDALAAKWFEQGYNAAKWGLKPGGFWTPDHQRGYLAAISA